MYLQFTTKHVYCLLSKCMTTPRNNQASFIQVLHGFGGCFGSLPPSCSTHPCCLEYIG